MMTDKELIEWARKGAVDMAPCCICGREFNLRSMDIGIHMFDGKRFDICIECWHTNFTPVIKEKLRELLCAKMNQLFPRGDEQ